MEINCDHRSSDCKLPMIKHTLNILFSKSFQKMYEFQMKKVLGLFFLVKKNKSVQIITMSVETEIYSGGENETVLFKDPLVE